MECDLPNAIRVTPSARIRFKCTGCGDCCRHVRESVPIDSQDAFRIAKHLRNSGKGISCPDQFLHQYASPAMLDACGYFMYFLNTVGEDDTCIFLKENRCSIHPAKPRACRLYPFMVDPTESEELRYLYSRDREHHFRGPIVETRSWMKKNLRQEDRRFLKLDYGRAKSVAMILRQIPDTRRTEAVLHFHRLRYSEYDLDLPFLEQFQRNQEKLLTILSAMTK